MDLGVQYRMGGVGSGGLGVVRYLNRRFDTVGEMYAPQTQAEFMACEDLVEKGLATRIEPTVEQVEEVIEDKRQQILDKLNSMEFAELKVICKQKGIVLKRTSKKVELIDLIMGSVG